MPKLSRTKYASYLPQDELDDYHLIEEEEEEDEYEDDDADDNQDDGDEEGDEHTLEASADDEDDEDEYEITASADDEDEEEKPKPSRAQERIRKLAKERKAAKEENENLRRQLASIGQNQQQRQQQPDPAQEATFRASLSPEELIRYDVGKILQTQKQQNDLQVFNMQDMMDQQSFRAKVSTNPAYARYANEVERRLLDLRTNQRMNVPREVILQNIIGEAVLSGKHKTISRDKAKENLKKNKTRPSSNRSDATREASRSGSEREKRRKRLESVSF